MHLPSNYLSSLTYVNHNTCVLFQMVVRVKWNINIAKGTTALQPEMTYSFSISSASTHACVLPTLVTLCLRQVSGSFSNQLKQYLSGTFSGLHRHYRWFYLIYSHNILYNSILTFNASSVIISPCKIKTEPNNGHPLAPNLMQKNESLTS